MEVEVEVKVAVEVEYQQHPQNHPSEQHPHHPQNHLSEQPQHHPQNHPIEQHQQLQHHPQNHPIEQQLHHQQNHPSEQHLHHPQNHPIEQQLHHQQNHPSEQHLHHPQNHPSEQHPHHPQSHPIEQHPHHPQNHPIEQHPHHPQNHPIEQHPQHQQVQPPHQVQNNLVEDVWNLSLQAIGRLEQWRGSEDKLGFFSLCLRPLTAQDPEIRRNIPELDRRLGMVVNQMIDSAGESFKTEENAILKERANQTRRRQELEQFSAELDRREHELRRHEAAILQNEVGRSQNLSHGRAQYPTGDERQTRFAEERGHPRHPGNYPMHNALPGVQCTHFQTNDLSGGATSVPLEGTAINYNCPRCDIGGSATTFNSVEFLQRDQGVEPQDMPSVCDESQLKHQW
ncbi:GL22562 [Drosophila persimilis]|uniref:GL22562 n=1 Tax=Drosophila persimilis TaxID=7234 RepID=B4H170_DROPE|nr:GL22562 [Drosophila persimilis]